MKQSMPHVCTDMEIDSGKFGYSKNDACKNVSKSKGVEFDPR
jgi:hypothetical protein